MKPSEPVVCFTQSTIELLFEFVVFLFQFSNAPLFGKDHQVFRCIGFACWKSYLLPYRLFPLLLAKGLNSLFVSFGINLPQAATVFATI